MVILYKNTIEMKDKTSHLQLHEKIKKRCANKVTHTGIVLGLIKFV